MNLCKIAKKGIFRKLLTSTVNIWWFHIINKNVKLNNNHLNMVYKITKKDLDPQMAKCIRVNI